MHLIPLWSVVFNRSSPWPAALVKTIVLNIYVPPGVHTGRAMNPWMPHRKIQAADGATQLARASVGFSKLKLMSCPSQRQVNRKQKQPHTHRTKLCVAADEMSRQTFAPVAVLVHTVSEPAVFNNGEGSGSYFSVPHRRHLYQSLSDWRLIGRDGRVCVVLTFDVISPLCWNVVALQAAWLDADTCWWGKKNERLHKPCWKNIQ